MKSAAPFKISENAYTHAPALHENLAWAGVQVLAWLLFRPSAWRNHIARIAPDLAPDFCLGSLRREQWRDPALWRLVVIGYGLWPLWVGGLVGLVQAGLGWSRNEIALCVLDCVLRSVTTSIGVGIAISLAAGIASVVMTGAAVGIAYMLSPVLITNVHDSSVEQYALAVAVGITLNVAVSVTEASVRRSRTTLVGSVVLGGLIGCLVLGLTNLVAVGVAQGMPGDIKAYVAADVPTVPFTFVAALLGGMLLGVGLGWRIRDGRRGWRFGIALGLFFAVVSSTPYAIEKYVRATLGEGLVLESATGVRRGMWYGVRNSAYFTLPHMLTAPVAGPGAGAVAGALAYGSLESLRQFSKRDVPPGEALVLFALSLVAGLTFPRWRSWVFYPLASAWSAWCYRLDARRENARFHLLRWHTAFWDEHQRLPLHGLDRHLLLVWARAPAEGQAALAYLVRSPQRWAAQAAQIEMDARALERCLDVGAIGAVNHTLAAGSLEGPANTDLRRFWRISQDVDTALRYTSYQHQRLSLRLVAEYLDDLVRALEHRAERYDSRLCPIARQWHGVVMAHLQTLAQTTEQRQEIANPHLVDVPLRLGDAVFVARPAICADITRFLLRDDARFLLLYGQRRIGKTSLLNHLGSRLPETVVPLLVDLQGAVAKASSRAGLFYAMAQAMARAAGQQRAVALPSLEYEALTSAPRARFEAWLDDVDVVVGQGRALLVLDEFEALDRAIAKGRFDAAAVLGLLGHLPQRCPRFKVLLSGSHSLDECPYWATYLPEGVQVIALGYLEEHEAHRLIARPVPDFALRYEPAALRRVLTLTRRHPALIQRLCSEIVMLKNQQPVACRRVVCLEDVEAAVPAVLTHGSLFFAHIQHHQVTACGARILRFIAAQGEGAVVSPDALTRHIPDGLDHTLAQLIRRDLIETVDGNLQGYRFQIELVRRWFAEVLP